MNLFVLFCFTFDIIRDTVSQTTHKLLNNIGFQVLSGEIISNYLIGVFEFFINS